MIPTGVNDDARLRRLADALIMTVYASARQNGLPVSFVLKQVLLDARARLVERGMLTRKQEPRT